MEGFSLLKKPLRDSGTSEPVTSPVVPHFLSPPYFRGHNAEKCGTGPELLNDHRREQMRSYIAMLRRPKLGWNVVRDAARPASGYACILFRDVMEKEKFYRAVMHNSEISRKTKNHGIANRVKRSFNIF
jgi:hypothetical protein